MDIMALLAKSSTKQRLTILGAVSALMIGLNQYPDPPQAAPGPAGNQEEVMSAPGDGVLPNGYNPNAVIRDPFAVPIQFQQQQQPVSAAPAGAGQGPQSPAGKTRGPLPVVQGIVGAGDAKVAILADGADSRSYRTGERIGAYVITAISNSSVTLRGPEGIVVVPMGR